jgi:hypothetical protein
VAARYDSEKARRGGGICMTYPDNAEADFIVDSLAWRNLCFYDTYNISLSKCKATAQQW